jgi:hypothetical protein
MVVLSTEKTTRLTALSSAAMAFNARVPETVCPEARPVSETLGAALDAAVVFCTLIEICEVELRPSASKACALTVCVPFESVVVLRLAE